MAETSLPFDKYKRKEQLERKNKEEIFGMQVQN